MDPFTIFAAVGFGFLAVLLAAGIIVLCATFDRVLILQRGKTISDE